jgi:hypothetical protein
MANGSGSLSLGQSTVAYARGKLGQSVGRGECYDLADKALRHAGAKSAPSYGEITDDADYVWGDAISAKDAQPGDILQFRDFDVTILTTTVTKTSRKDGSSATQTNTNTETFGRPHHTAVVESNDGNGNLTILEQNVPLRGRKTPSKKVQRNRIAWKNSQSHPPKDRKQGKNGTLIEVTTTVQVTVEGTLWVYRPATK